MPESTISRSKNIRNTAVVGGAQVIQILAGIIRGKFIAVLLGPVGVGINGILNSVIGIITQVVGLGLNFSAVREIAQPSTQSSTVELSKTVSTIKSWLYVSSLLGAVITIGLSYYLSVLSFDNNQYVYTFMILSMAVVFNVLNNGNLSIIQGLHRIKLLAYASMLGSLVGLFTSIPLYYLFGIESIPYAIVMAAITAYVVSNIMVRKLKIKPANISPNEIYTKGKEMVALGIVLMLAQVIGLVVIYAINSFITHSASLVDLGFYQAGVGITTQYSSLIFTAMATEYFPRLSSLCHERAKTNETINQQIEISLLIITPIVLAVVITAPVIIRILLSDEFVHIQRFIELMAVSIVLKGASFPIGYLSFARGDKRIFFNLEGIGGSSLILLSGVVGFWLWGLNGIAYLTIITNLLYLVVILAVTRLRYGYHLNKTATRLILISVATSLGVVGILTNYQLLNVVIAGTICVVAIAWYVYELNKIINVIAFIKSKLSR